MLMLFLVIFSHSHTQTLVRSPGINKRMKLIAEASWVPLRKGLKDIGQCLVDVWVPGRVFFFVCLLAGFPCHS